MKVWGKAFRFRIIKAKELFSILKIKEGKRVYWHRFDSVQCLKWCVG